MPGGVEDVDAVSVVVELEDGGRDGDTALFLDLHPVGDGVPLRLARLDGAREMDRASVEEELFGERGLARVRMRDDRERAPFGNLCRELFF